jgi:hypothetical protein
MKLLTHYSSANEFAGTGANEFANTKTHYRIIVTKFLITSANGSRLKTK